MYKLHVILVFIAAIYTANACHPLWFNQCHDHSECCSGFCYKGEGDMWLDGVCKPGPKSEPITGSCHPLWYNKCRDNSECCSGFCFKGDNNVWLDGLCKPQANQQTTTTTELPSLYDLIDPRFGSRYDDNESTSFESN